MTNESDFLISLSSQLFEEGIWRPDEIVIRSAEVSANSEFVCQLLALADENPGWFQNLTLIVPGDEGPDPDKNIIGFQGDLNLNIDELKSAIADVKDPADYVGQTHHDFGGSDYSAVVAAIFDGIPDRKDLELTFSIDKDSILESIYPEAEVPSHVQFWINRETLSQWISETTTEEVIQSQFAQKTPTYHVFLEYSEMPSEYLGFTNLSQFSGAETTHPKVARNNCRDETNIISNLFQDTSLTPPSAPPSVFDSDDTRQVYSKVFLASSMSVLAKDCEINGDKLEITTQTHRHHIDSTVDLGAEDQLEFDSQALENLYNLILEINQRSASISISFWQQAVATQCSDFLDIPSQTKAISHYAGFLQEESAKEELEQLQSTIEEVSDLTRTIADSLSESSRELTSNLQNIVIALLGAIVTNFVLILRYSDFYVLAPFSVAAISGVLIFYYPIVQSSIDNTQEMMENRTQDFLIYLGEIRSHVDSRVFDLDRIRVQHEAHLETAAKSLITTRKTISRVHLMMILLWAILVSYGLLVTVDIPDSQILSQLSEVGVKTSANKGVDMISVTVMLSAIPASWIFIKNTRKLSSWKSFFSTSEIPSEPDVTIRNLVESSNDVESTRGTGLSKISSESYYEYYPILWAVMLIEIIVVACFRLVLSI